MKINPPPKLKIKVLYVEDDLVIRENIAALLNRRIESLEIASDGEEGFAKFKKFHPDLLITDIKMPKMDGITLSRNIFELDPDTNIIIMSAFSDTEYMLEAINLGIDHYIIKPTNFQKLFDVILKIEKIIRLRVENERQKLELIRAKDLAIEANRVKDKIMRLVAHDLKKPFVGIIQLIEVLKSNELISKDPEISNLLKMILDKSNSQIEMIGDLLNTDRIKLGGRFIKPEKFNISKLVNSTYNEFIELFENKRIQFKNLIPSELEIFADKNLVREVFKNLISNSIKFSYRGTRIQVSSKEEKHGYSFIFEDQGIGIEPDKLKEILSNNEVIDSEKGTEGEFGTGIGLNLIINIMKFHSGDIKIETEVNNGTKIILFFPG